MTKVKLTIVLLLTLLFCGQAWGADYVCTLWVAGDESDENSWAPKTLFGDCWEEIDETSPDDDGSYIYGDAAGDKQNWKYDAVSACDTAGKTIDSITYVNRAKYSGGSAGTSKLTFWRKKWDGEEFLWRACTPWDTVTLTDSYVNYSKTFTEDPCGDVPWDWAWINYDDLYCWGVRIFDIRTGLPSATIRVTHSALYIYSHTEEAAEGRPKENILGGGIVK